MPMSPKNIDETIQKLLNNYAKWCKTVLDKKTKLVQAQYFHEEKERAVASQEITKAKNAYNILLEVAQNPKKYLYSGKKFNEASYDKKSLLQDNLEPLLGGDFDHGDNKLFLRLADNITNHVKFGENNEKGVWVYYGDNDSDAKEIIQMNKIVQLWNANALIAILKDFAPAYVFAVDMKEDNKR